VLLIYDLTFTYMSAFKIGDKVSLSDFGTTDAYQVFQVEIMDTKNTVSHPKINITDTRYSILLKGAELQWV
jgi:sortase (surface protein transpeptidase)